jgi:hypothetical protein
MNQSITTPIRSMKQSSLGELSRHGRELEKQLELLDNVCYSAVRITLNKQKYKYGTCTFNDSAVLNRK